MAVLDAIVGVLNGRSLFVATRHVTARPYSLLTSPVDNDNRVWQSMACCLFGLPVLLEQILVYVLSADPNPTRWARCSLLQNRDYSLQ